MKEMIRQRMKKLHRGNSSSSDKSGERIDFKFSSFQALQVPRGWDKLSVSLVSVETGKTISKTGRASVWNGNCRWTETLSECVWVHDDSKELEQNLYKLLVSMGSARSGILGEVTVNLASHMNSTTSAPTALPLKNCSHGTILQVQIQCLTPRATSRKDSDSLTDEANADYDDIDNKSDVSDGQFTKSDGSSSSTFLSTSHPGEPGSRFDVDVPGGAVYKESTFTEAGKEVVAADSPIGRLGLTVCYDLRFPEIYQQLRFHHEAQVLLVPSAFTKVTGEAHWEILLRARAIETQCYVIAAAQAGKHSENRESFGETLIIDPWGTIIGRLPDRVATGITVADIDFSLIDSVRAKMPISQHRKPLEFWKQASL